MNFVIIKIYILFIPIANFVTIYYLLIFSTAEKTKYVCDAIPELLKIQLNAHVVYCWIRDKMLIRKQLTVKNKLGSVQTNIIQQFKRSHRVT